VNKIVLIGTDLDNQAISKSFQESVCNN